MFVKGWNKNKVEEEHIMDQGRRCVSIIDENIESRQSLLLFYEYMKEMINQVQEESRK